VVSVAVLLWIANEVRVTFWCVVGEKYVIEVFTNSGKICLWLALSKSYFVY
jgi:hypothetical protein